MFEQTNSFSIKHLMLSLFLSFLTHSVLFSNTLCITQPSDQQSLVECNRITAYTFAPHLNQFVDPCVNDGVNGDADRILKVNYDGNFNALDNWENLEFLASYGTDAYPNAYYQVLWTENFWLITYSFYWARDYAQSEPGCGNDEHEGDIGRVFVVVKRPANTAEAQSPEDLIRRVNSTGHGAILYNCLNEDHMDVVPPGSATLTPGAHVTVWSSAGSHSFYDNRRGGYRDNDGLGDKFNPCKPKPKAMIKYRPRVNNNFLPINQVVSCSEQDLSGLHESQIYIGATTEYYSLIDMFDDGDGLWRQRNNPHLFNGDRMICNTGGGCPNKAPYAPWQGNFGSDPIIEQQNTGVEFPSIIPLHPGNPALSSLHCFCKEDGSDCEDLTFSDTEFTSNPFACSNTDYRLSYSVHETLESATTYELTIEGPTLCSGLTYDINVNPPEALLASETLDGLSFRMTIVNCQSVDITVDVSNPCCPEDQIIKVRRTFSYYYPTYLSGHEYVPGVELSSYSSRSVTTGYSYQLDGTIPTIPPFNSATFEWEVVFGTATIYPSNGIGQTIGISFPQSGTSHLSLDVSSACGDYSYLYFFNSSGFLKGEGGGSKHLKVYPNPFLDNVSVTFDQAKEMDTPFIRVRLIDKFGNELARQDNGHFSDQVDLNLKGLDLQPGIYYLEVFDGEETHYEQIVRKFD